MNRLLVWVAVAIAIGLLLWRIDHLSHDRDALQLQRDQLSARAASLQNTLRIQRELTATAEALDRKHSEELTDANTENARLAAAVAAGEYRLRVAASCPAAGVSDPASTTGMDDGEAAELTPAARQDYFALRAQLIRTEAALVGLQEHVIKVCLR